MKTKFGNMKVTLLMMICACLITLILPINPNNAVSAATDPYESATKLTLKNGKTVKKTYKYADGDWKKYTKIVVKKGSKITVSLKSYLKSNVEVSIEQADHTVLHSMITDPLQDGETSNSVKFTELYSPGTYYIVLSHITTTADTGKCVLQVKTTELKDTEDADHASILTAQKLKNSKTTYGVLSQEESQEFYKFTVKKGQTGKIKITSAKPITINLRNDTSLLQEDKEITSCSINVKDLDAGTYYIVVQKVNSISTTYSIKMSVK